MAPHTHRTTSSSQSRWAKSQTYSQKEIDAVAGAYNRETKVLPVKGNLSNIKCPPGNTDQESPWCGMLPSGLVGYMCLPWERKSPLFLPSCLLNHVPPWSTKDYTYHFHAICNVPIRCHITKWDALTLSVPTPSGPRHSSNHQLH